MAASAPATVWEKNYGEASYNEQSYQVWQTGDCGFIISGYSDNIGDTTSSRLWLVKTDWQGNEMWTQFYSINGPGTCVRQTSDGGYIVTGNAGGNVFALKTDESGNSVWSQIYPRPNNWVATAESIWPTADGGYILAGSINREDNNRFDMYVVKIDSAGNKLWEKMYGGVDTDSGTGCDYCTALWPTNDGGYILGGWDQSQSFGGQGALVKIDADGNQQWYKVYGTKDETHSATYAEVQQTHDGGYILAGSNTGKVWLLKVDSSGGKQWDKTYDGYEASSVQQTWDDGYVFTDSKSGLVIRTDSSGNVLWQKTLIGLGFMKSASVLQIGNGSYVVAGVTAKSDSGSEKTDVYLGQLAKDMNPVPNAQFISPRDAYMMDAGKLYYLTLVMTNNGTMPWTFQDGTVLAPSSDSEDMQYFNMTNTTIPIGTVVRPGQSIKVNFTYTAPAMNGTYHPEVRMFWTNHGFFGEPAKFTFFVVNGTPDTRTPTAAATAVTTAKPVSGATEKPAATEPGQPEPTVAVKKSGGLPCLSSVVLPMLIVGTVGVGLYQRRKREN